VFLQSRYATLVAVVGFVAVAAMMGLLERVIVVDNRNPRYCGSCRYDLSGNVSGACPECGEAVR
jgi:hypothetical protein